MKQLIFFLTFLSFCVLATPFTLYTSKSGLINSNVHCIEKGEKFIWVGTSAGINRILFEGDKPVQFSARETSVPVTALENDGDFIWAGLKGKGLYKMIKKNYKLIGFRKDVLSNKKILDIKRVKKGLIVFTSSQKFIFDFGKEKYSVTSDFIEEYNPNIEIKGKILRNNNDTLKRYNPSTKSFHSFEKSIHARCHLNWESGVLIATHKGLIFYQPENDSIRFGDPKIELLTFKLNNKDTTPGDLNLNWGEYKFSYDFKFRELGIPGQINLFYSINEGENKIEKVVSASEGIELRNLDYGTYELEVFAKNEKGVLSKNSLNYTFSIGNPLSDSIWLYLIIAFSFGIWTWIVIIIIQSKNKKKMRILEDALIEKTSKLNQIEKMKYGLVNEDKIKLF